MERLIENARESSFSPLASEARSYHGYKGSKRGPRLTGGALSIIVVLLSCVASFYLVLQIQDRRDKLRDQSVLARVYALELEEARSAKQFLTDSIADLKEKLKVLKEGCKEQQEVLQADTEKTKAAADALEAKVQKQEETHKEKAASTDTSKQGLQKLKDNLKELEPKSASLPKGHANTQGGAGHGQAA